MTTEQETFHQRNDIVGTPPSITEPAAITAPPTITEPATVTASTSRVQTWSGSRFEPDALIAAAIGLVLTVIGLIAVLRGGFDGPFAQPVVSVLGFTHTTALGMIEIAIGLALLLSGATRSRPAELFFGVILGVGGFVGAVQTSSFDTSLALESAMAWLATLAGTVVVAATLLLPRFTSRSVTNSER